MRANGGKELRNKITSSGDRAGPKIEDEKPYKFRAPTGYRRLEDGMAEDYCSEARMHHACWDSTVTEATSTTTDMDSDQDERMACNLCN
jgi:hypothetical protein